MKTGIMASLLRKELFFGVRAFIIFSIAGPVLISLAVNLLFGSLFASRPELAVFDRGDSRLPEAVEALESVDVIRMTGKEQLIREVSRGQADMGIILPEDLDSDLESGTSLVLDGFVWGESIAKDRMTIGVAIASAARDLQGQEAPVTVNTQFLGDESTVSWDERLLPLIVLITIFFGGMLLPAISIIQEKNDRTLTALLTTPARPGDIFTAKGVLSFIITLGMGVFILFLNTAFGFRPGLMIGVLTLGVIMAVCVGLILGVVLQDTNTLFTLWKSAGIVLFGPAIVFMFPAIPVWVGRFFPTFYLIKPVMDLGKQGPLPPVLFVDTAVLVLIDIFLVLIAVLIIRRRDKAAAFL